MRGRGWCERPSPVRLSSYGAICAHAGTKSPGGMIGPGFHRKRAVAATLWLGGGSVRLLPNA